LEDEIVRSGVLDTLRRSRRNADDVIGTDALRLVVADEHAALAAQYDVPLVDRQAVAFRGHTRFHARSGDRQAGCGRVVEVFADEAPFAGLELGGRCLDDVSGHGRFRFRERTATIPS
jgi:hypothetical protein